MSEILSRWVVFLAYPRVRALDIFAPKWYNLKGKEKEDIRYNEYTVIRSF